MKYDFTTAPDRRNTGSYKWEQMYGWNPDTPAGIVPFSVADMELKNAPEICQGLAEYATSDQVFGYTGPSDNFLEAVSGWMKRRHHWEIQKDWIVTVGGVVPGFYVAVQTFVKPGEGVIIMTPVYYPFFMAMELSGREIARNPLIKTETGYEIDFDDLEEKAKDPNNKALLFCSPHNPVGRVWTKEELEKVAEICARHNILILDDEIHNDLIMPGHDHIVMSTISEEAANNMLVFTAPSKSFNLAGLNCSNVIISNQKLREEYQAALQLHGHIMVNCFGYKACELAYNRAEAWLDELIQLVWHNHLELKKYLGEHLPEVKVYDLQGTYLQWMDFNAFGMTNEELEEFMHKDALMFLDEGYIFGHEGNGFERINLACPTSILREALERVVKALKAREGR